MVEQFLSVTLIVLASISDGCVVRRSCAAAAFCVGVALESD